MAAALVGQASRRRLTTCGTCPIARRNPLPSPQERWTQATRICASPMPSCRGSVVGVGLVLGVATSEPMLVGAMRAEATPQIGFLLAALALQSSPPVRSL